VQGPALAIESINGLSWLSDSWISSSKSSPQIETPPVPSPSGSPV
jgi:hypothetical protein